MRQDVLSNMIFPCAINQGQREHAKETFPVGFTTRRLVTVRSSPSQGAEATTTGS